LYKRRENEIQKTCDLKKNILTGGVNSHSEKSSVGARWRQRPGVGVFFKPQGKGGRWGGVWRRGKARAFEPEALSEEVKGERVFLVEMNWGGKPCQGKIVARKQGLEFFRKRKSVFCTKGGENFTTLPKQGGGPRARDGLGKLDKEHGGKESVIWHYLVSKAERVKKGKLTTSLLKMTSWGETDLGRERMSLSNVYWMHRPVQRP